MGRITNKASYFLMTRILLTWCDTTASDSVHHAVHPLRGEVTDLAADGGALAAQQH